MFDSLRCELTPGPSFQEVSISEQTGFRRLGPGSSWYPWYLSWCHGVFVVSWCLQNLQSLTWKVWVYYTCSGSSSTTSTIQSQPDAPVSQPKSLRECTRCLVSGRWILKCNQTATQPHNIDTHYMIPWYVFVELAKKRNECWMKHNLKYVLLWVYIMCSTWHVESDNCGRRIGASRCQSKLCFSSVLAHCIFENCPTLKSEMFKWNPARKHLLDSTRICEHAIFRRLQETIT